MSGTSLATGGIVSKVSTTTITGADWTIEERKQIRSALGVVGDKTDVEDSQIVNALDKHDQTMKGLIL